MTYQTQGWALNQPLTVRLVDKLRRAGRPLGKRHGQFSRGILTGLNKAFVIDEGTRQGILETDPASAQLIKPWLQGRNIKRWRVEWGHTYAILIQNSGDSDARNPWANERTEASARSIFRSIHPGIHAHLSRYEDELRTRLDQGRYWWELRACAYFADFSKPKILWPDIAKECRFAYDPNGLFGGNTLYVLPTDDVALLAVLNSPVIEFFYRQISSTIQNDYLRFIAQYMEQLPIPEIDDAMRRELEPRVRRLLELAGQGPEARRLEDEVNQMVYRLFDLTAEEIELIESQLKGKTEVT